MLSVFLTLLSTSAVQDPATQDWPSFRGPNASGVATATGLPEVLDVEENAVWRAELPPGYSSPIVVRERVVCTGIRDGLCVTLCFDAQSGEPLWAVEAPEPLHTFEEQFNTPASPTPASDGERLFVLFPTFGMIAYDLAGEELWRRPMERFSVPHGMSSSPMPVREMVLLQVDQDVGSHLLALNGRTGEVVWDVPRPGITHGYASPVTHLPPGSEGIVITNGSFRAAAYSLEDGKELWWFDGLGWDTSILPLVDDEGVYLGSNGPPLNELGVRNLSGTWEEALAARDADEDGMLTAAEWEEPGIERMWYYFDLDGDGSMSAAEHAHAIRRQSTKRSMVAIGFDGKGDVTDTHLRWTYDDSRGLPNVGSPVLVDGILFLVKDSIVTSLRAADGAVLKQERAGGLGESIASPVAADGKVYLASTAGALTVLSAAGEWEVLGQSELREEVWATPAIACGAVYVRSQEALYCFREDE